MNGQEIAVGSRGSRLALAQANLVVEAFERAGQPSRIVVVETAGDRRAPDTAWGEGAFVAAIERALVEGHVDAAVHSAKDVPTEEDRRLLIAAYLARADPRDAIVVRADGKHRRLDDLPAGSRVGTDSPRRTGFVLARRPDLVVHPLHGNVDTRLRRLDAGETDALVLACAGLDRSGFGNRIAERLDPQVVPPAPGQGAIAVQIRRDDAGMLTLAAAIDHGPTRLAVEAERAFLRASGGGCRSPIGALATIAGDELDLLGGYASLSGSSTAFARQRGPLAAGEQLARGLAAELRGGARVLPRRVLVVRAAGQAEALLSALRDAGLDPVHVPTIQVEIEPPGSAIDAAALRLQEYAWAVVTSPNGARAIIDAADNMGAPLDSVCWAAIGLATRAILERAGARVEFQPSRASSIAMAVELPVAQNERVLLIRGDLADVDLMVALRARGTDADDVIAYRTREAPEASGPLLRAAFADGPIDAVIITSGSTVRGLVALAHAQSLDVMGLPAVCIGPETAAEAREAGFQVVAIAASPVAGVLAATTADVLAAQPEEIR